MKKIKVLILIFFATTNLSLCLAQKGILADACSKLSRSIYEEPFNQDEIEQNLELFQYQLENSSKYAYENCNCADSLWVLSNSHQYKYIKRTHSNTLDTINYLNNVIHEIDRMNLRREFRFQNLPTLIDSFKYVIERLRIKQSKEKYIYNLITAEIDFLKAYRYTITNQYFEIIDNKASDPEIIDVLLVSLFNSNDQISDRIKGKIGKEQHERYFYRMYGIIISSSSNKFPINQLDILSCINYQIEEEKISFILMSFYKYNTNNLVKLKRKHKRKMRRVLANPYFENMKPVNNILNELK